MVENNNNKLSFGYYGVENFKLELPKSNNYQFLIFKRVDIPNNK